MENYALSIANYFIELSQQDGRILRPLKLMKLVYIAHGYMLALLDRSTDGTKRERVEAWQYGPVFPSVYYSFKNYAIYTDTSLVTILHAKGTPWERLYKKDKNVIIPDSETKAYYKDIIKRTLES